MLLSQALFLNWFLSEHVKNRFYDQRTILLKASQKVVDILKRLNFHTFSISIEFFIFTLANSWYSWFILVPTNKLKKCVQIIFGTGITCCTMNHFQLFHRGSVSSQLSIAMVDISVLRGCVIFETFGKCGLYVVTLSFIGKSTIQKWRPWHDSIVRILTRK